MRTLPSLKEKRRYLVFEVISERKHGLDEVKKAIMDSLTSFLGASGMAKAKMRMLADKWDEDKQKGVIVMERKNLDSVKAALCMATSVSGEKAIIRSAGASGILKKAVEKFY